MQISAVLDHKGHDVKAIGPDTPVVVAVHRMEATGVGSLVVRDEGDRPVGVLSERDIVRGLVHHGEGLLKLRAHDVATRSPITCRADDDVTAVMERMTRRRQRHVPVVDDAGRLMGLVSIGDLVKSRLGDLELQTNVLRDLAHH
jgi:CBS domain-containing protein